jgi:protein-tyrosine phosphatase
VTRAALAWEGCVNVRDVAGLPLEDGGTTASHVLVRADNVRGLSDAGWQALHDYGVRRIVDLRWTEELDYYRWSYLEFLTEFQGSFGHAVSALAGAQGTALVHCAGGKDRTGLVAALVLEDAGVAHGAIAADWALSERAWADWSQAWIDESADELERDRRRVFSVAPPEAMLEVLQELGRRGGARAYLEEAGAAPDDLDRVRARLRGEV